MEVQSQVQASTNQANGERRKRLEKRMSVHGVTTWWRTASINYSRHTKGRNEGEWSICRASASGQAVRSLDASGHMAPNPSL